MNSGTIFSQDGQVNDNSHLNKTNPVQLNLSNEQFLYIQHHLPKGFALIQRKTNKREKKETLNKIQSENVSRLSQNFDDEDRDQRKRNIKKKYNHNDDQIPKPPKRTLTQKIQTDIDITHCFEILDSLKKHQKAFPFLKPVDPEESGALDYFDVIKEPMDFSTAEKKLKSGAYENINQFKTDINKIWSNSYKYNDKTSPIYKMAQQMEKYTKKLESSISKRGIKVQKVRFSKSMGDQKVVNSGQQNEDKINAELLSDKIKTPPDTINQVLEVVGKQKVQNPSYSMNRSNADQISNIVESFQNSNSPNKQQDKVQNEDESPSGSDQYQNDSNNFS